jgi:serine/threonine protein phosphatase PrpC
LDIVGASGSLEQTCEELITEGKSSGSDDNLTCLLLRATRQSPAAKMLGALLGTSKHQWQDSM